MVNKCCVGGCRSNYESQDVKIKTFRFPTDEKSKQAWYNALPNKMENITRNMVVCIKHWPANFRTVRKKGHDLPADPPSIFENTPLSYRRQSLINFHERNIEQRSVSMEARQCASNDGPPEVDFDSDTISNWITLTEFCATKDLVLDNTDEGITLLKLEKNPPKLIYSIHITKEFGVSCNKGNTAVPVREYLGFAAKLQRFSKLDLIIEKLEMFDMHLSTELQSIGEQVFALLPRNDLSEQKKTQLDFIGSQILLQTYDPNGRRYSPSIMKQAIVLFLRSRNCYSSIRDILALPSAKTLTKYFGCLGDPGSNEECKRTIDSVFSELNGMQKFCKVLIDEMHIKPAIRYQGCHIIGNAVDEPEKAARTILAIMIAPFMGGPAFVARLIPIYSLKADLLFEQCKIIIEIIHQNFGFVFLLMSDNLRTNQKCFGQFHKTYGSVNVFSINHPVKNTHFEQLYIFYDPTHLVKNIRNNWVTEKMQKLRYFDTSCEEAVTAKWSDLISIYNEEKDNDVRITPINYATLHPSNFEKQKVKLVQNVFNEKTVAALTIKGYHDTATFVSHVTKLWNILNTKSAEKGFRLNDADREPIRSVDDKRLSYLNTMASNFLLMDTSKSVYETRIMQLTKDTSNALHITLNGLVDLVKNLLNKGVSYVLPGEFQSDRLEGEFGVYRQSCGGNYYISFEQVKNALCLRRIKLYHTLNITQEMNHISSKCCEERLNEDELNCLDQCLEMSSHLSEFEKSSLYFISGYVAFKENMKSEVLPADILGNDSEFTDLVSRGKLTLYAYFKDVKEKVCCNKLLKAFREIYECTFSNFENQQSILRRFVNTFCKGHVTRKTDAIREQKNDIKKKRLSNR